jgi:PD-(D/E)XK nuclease superfamily
MISKVIDTPYNDLTYKIIGCAMAVHRELGPGLRENSYQRSFANFLLDASLSYKEESLYHVYDDPAQERLIGYLIVSELPVGLLINFGEKSLRHPRVFPPQTVKQPHINRQWLFVPDWLKADILKYNPDEPPKSEKSV